MDGFENIVAIQVASVPSGCEGCGVQCELRARVVSLEVQKYMAARAAESLVGRSGEAFDALVEDRMKEDTADSIKNGVRRRASDEIESLERQLTEAKEQIDTNALACSGVLKMRAKKDGVTYTVNVCTSPAQYDRGSNLSTLPTQISARSTDSQTP